MHKAISRLACVLLLLFYLAAKTYACFCSGGTPCEDTWKAAAVIVGTVVSIENHKPVNQEDHFSHEVKMVVEESFRGDVGIVTTLLTVPNSCAFPFQIGKQYLVYAQQASNKRLTTSTCTRTRLLSEASEDLLYLRNLPNAKLGGSIQGTVERLEHDKDGRAKLTPMAKIRMVVDSDLGKSEAVTDEKGVLEIKGLSAGTYKVSINLPAGVSSGKTDASVVVEDKGCASVHFYVQTKGRLSGLVRNVLGAPVSNAEITLFHADGARYQGFQETAGTNEQGRYDFRMIAPGKYKLQIRFDGLTRFTRAFPKFFHPGVSTLAQATVVEIGDGEEIQNYNLTVPEMPRDRIVEGVVVSPSGTIIEDAKVLVGFEYTFQQLPLDSQGRFSLRVYEGASVTVFAYVDRDGKRLQSGLISIPATGDPGKLKLVIAPQ